MSPPDGFRRLPRVLDRLRLQKKETSPSPAIITTARWAPDTARKPSLIITPLRLLHHAADTSSSARCLSEVSSNERCTWLVRLVYRGP